MIASVLCDCFPCLVFCVFCDCDRNVIAIASAIAVVIIAMVEKLVVIGGAIALAVWSVAGA